MINTCALDTVLFLIYHIRNNWIYVSDRIDSCTETLKYAMQLMDINDHDMARYVLTKANTNFSHIKESDNFFYLDSSAEDWLNVIKKLTSMTFEKLIQCAKYKKDLRNEIIMNCISVQVIDSNIVQEIKRKQQSEEVRKCGSLDYVIGDDNSDILVYEPKCGGDEITQDNIVNILSILTIVASEHVGCDYMFLDLPDNIRFMNINWELSGAILKMNAISE